MISLHTAETNAKSSKPKSFVLRKFVASLFDPSEYQCSSPYVEKHKMVLPLESVWSIVGVLPDQSSSFMDYNFESRGLTKHQE